MSRKLRALDLAIIAVAAPIWVPAFGALSLAVLVTSGRPVLFCQERIGRNGEPFTMRKFRSMSNGDNPLIPDPDRITQVGGFLRRTSLDELPQLLNVIEGTMSLVGPRPILPQQLAFVHHRQMRRHRVRPGMTGMAQVNGRNALTWDERFEFDVAWAEHPSLHRYMSILWRTVATVVSGSGISGHDPNDRLIVNLDADRIEPDLPAANEASSSLREAA